MSMPQPISADDLRDDPVPSLMVKPMTAPFGMGSALWLWGFQTPDGHYLLYLPDAPIVEILGGDEGCRILSCNRPVHIPCSLCVVALFRHGPLSFSDVFPFSVRF